MTLRTTAAAIGIALSVLCATPARADITLNLKDADIGTLIETVSEVTGKNFIVDPRVKGKVTVVSSSPMSSAGLYETFLAVLSVNGFAAIPAGDTIKIIPEASARQEGSARFGDGARRPKDEMVTHVYQLQNINAAQLVPILRPLVPQWGHLAAYQPNNSLIIADHAANVERLGRLIHELDQAGDREIEFVRLKHASASEVVRILTAMTQQDKKSDPTASAVSVIADERSNSILVGGDKADRERFTQIIKQLDVPLDNDGATQVVYLRYATAENLAPILEGYAKQIGKADGAGGTPGSPAAAASSGSSDSTRVLADKETNALIITAPPKTMRQIRDVVAQLDIQRAQVLVEGIVAEVSANRSNQLGIDWAVYNQNRIAAAGILDPSTLSAVGSIATAGTTAAGAAALGQGLNVVGGASNNGGTSFGILLKALAGDGDSNVLSTPTLVTLDNEEAKFSVGQEVPFLTGQYSNSGTTSSNGVVNPFQTIQRKDVGLSLAVTPQISGDSETIKLKIDLEVSSLSSGAAGGANLITNKRTLSNVVGIRDGQILVIAGLIDDQINDQQRRVPVLSKLPLIGGLFRYRSIDKTKRNLMLFIRPSVLRKRDDGDYYTRKKYDAVRQAQIDAATGAGPVIGSQRPILQPLETWSREQPPGHDADAAPKQSTAEPTAAPDATKAPDTVSGTATSDAAASATSGVAPSGGILVTP